jgi:hypothetical protein
MTKWDGKPDKVKRNTMIGNFEMGGLNMIDIGSYFASLRASWVSRFVEFYYIAIPPDREGGEMAI